MKKLLIAIAAIALLLPAAMAENLAVESFSYSPTPAVPGKYIDLWVHLKNDSPYVLKGVTFELDLKASFEGGSDFPFELEDGDSLKKELGTLSAKKTALIHYKIMVNENAFDGDYSIGLIYSSDGATSKKETVTVKIQNRNPDLEIVGIEPSEIGPGQSKEIELQIKNVGMEQATNVLVGVSEDRTVTSTGIVVERDILPVGGVHYIESIAPGEIYKAKISIGANPEAELKIHTVPVTLEYKDGNSNNLSETEYIGIKVSQNAELESVINSQTPLAVAGGTSELKIDLFNAGIGSAKYIVAELSSDAGEFENSKVFIGTLEADDFDSFKTDIKIDSGIEPGIHTLNLKLSYKNQFGMAEEMEIPLALKIYSPSEAGGDAGIDFWFLVVVAIVLYFVGKRVYKKYIKKQ